MRNIVRRYRQACRTRRWAKEREDAASLRLAMGAVELLVELRQMADYDRALPPALANHMRKDLWDDSTWITEALAMTGDTQKLRILGHRMRVGAGWSTDEATIDSTQPNTVRVLNAGRQVWISAEGLRTVDGQHWWGNLLAGRFRPDGTYGPAGADRGPSPIDADGLGRSMPELLAQLGEHAGTVD